MFIGNNINFVTRKITLGLLDTYTRVKNGLLPRI
jgi:hypothetical protein